MNFSHMKINQFFLFVLTTALAFSVPDTSYADASDSDNPKGTNDAVRATLPQTGAALKNAPKPEPLKPMENSAIFDEAVGLWISEGPGHTAPVSKLPRVHNGRNAVIRLIRAAQTGSLKEMPVAAVLRALEAMQVRDPTSEHDGCFR